MAQTPFHQAEIGHLIRSRRIKLGLSQSRLGDLIGRTATTVRRWERGEALPTDDVLDDLAEALRVRRRDVDAAMVVPGPHSKVIVAAPGGSSGPVLTPVPPPKDESPPAPPPVTDDAAEQSDGSPGSEPAGEAAPPPKPAPRPAAAHPMPGVSLMAVPPPGADEGLRPVVTVGAAAGAAAPAEPGARPWIEVPDEAVSPDGEATVEHAPPPRREERPVPPAPSLPVPPPPPVEAQVVLVEPGDYLDDPKQRALYTIRLIITLAVLAVGAVVMVWAMGELWQAIGGVLDSFTDTSLPSLTTSTLPGS